MKTLPCIGGTGKHCPSNARIVFMKHYKKGIAAVCSLFVLGVSQASAANVDAWSEEASNVGTVPNSVVENIGNTSSRPKVNLSGLAGATSASYEFLVNVPFVGQFSPFLLSDNSLVTAANKTGP